MPTAVTRLFEIRASRYGDSFGDIARVELKFVVVMLDELTGTSVTIADLKPAASQRTS